MIVWSPNFGPSNSLKRIEAEMPWHWSKVAVTRCWRGFDVATCSNYVLHQSSTLWSNLVKILCKYLSNIEQCLWSTCSQRRSSSVSTSWRWSSCSRRQLSRSCRRFIVGQIFKLLQEDSSKWEPGAQRLIGCGSRKSWVAWDSPECKNIFSYILFLTDQFL